MLCFLAVYFTFGRYILVDIVRAGHIVERALLFMVGYFFCRCVFRQSIRGIGYIEYYRLCSYFSVTSIMLFLLLCGRISFAALAARRWVSHFAFRRLRRYILQCHHCKSLACFLFRVFCSVFASAFATPFRYHKSDSISFLCVSIWYRLVHFLYSGCLSNPMSNHAQSTPSNKCLCEA